jgi:hypothetical protein
MSIKKWNRIVVVLLAIGCAATLGANAETHFGFSIGITNAPPPPRVVVADAPQLVAIPNTTVRVVGNTSYDVFAYHGSYYCYTHGFWYHAGSAAGPYMVVDVRSVPEPILVVPAPHWKHHPHGGPPGQMKKGRHGRP